jgi:hypothetical protein
MTEDLMDDRNQLFPPPGDRYNFVVEDAKRHFGEWDMCDPVVWEILRVVQAQNDLAHAINVDACYGAKPMVEAAIAERREAIAALLRAFEQEPRGFQ